MMKIFKVNTVMLPCGAQEYAPIGSRIGVILKADAETVWLVGYGTRAASLTCNLDDGRVIPLHPYHWGLESAILSFIGTRNVVDVPTKGAQAVTG